MDLIRQVNVFEGGRAEVVFRHADEAEKVVKMLEDYGFKRRSLQDTCPSCYTVRDFVADHPIGVYILATGSHVIAVINGTYFDTIDTGDYVPAYYWEKIM